MGIILKHSIRNILSKPLRLIVLVLCITIACFAALLSFDLKGNIITYLNSYTMHVFGDVDIAVVGGDEDCLKGIEDISDVTCTGIAGSRSYFYSHDPEDYHYVEEDNYHYISFSSLEAACHMRLIADDLVIDDNSAVASGEFLEKHDMKIGDTVTIRTGDDESIDLIISDSYDIETTYLEEDLLIVSENVMKRATCSASTNHTLWFIDVADQKAVSEVAALIRHNAPKANVLDLYSIADDNEENIKELTYLFYLIFLITFLLVIFVTISLAEKIVNERMSVIGTLRSLGVKPFKTALILLVENALYAVIGAVFGSILYSVLKTPLLKSIFFFVDGEDFFTDTVKHMKATPVSLYVAIIIGAIIVECAYPLFELIKAVKTPIRDIIFNNKDTEFKYTWKRVYIGAAAALISIVTLFMVKSFALLVVSFVSGVVALAVILPYIIRFIAYVLAHIFKKCKMPVAQLASENISRNKSTMGNSTLCVISLLLSVIIVSVAGPLWKWLSPDNLGYDVKADILYVDGEDYSYLKNVEGITDYDYIYSYYCFGTIAGPSGQSYEDDNDDPIISVNADTAHTLCNYLPREPYGLTPDEIVISEYLAERYAISVGEEITVTLHTDSDFPNIFTFKVADIYDPYDVSGDAVPDDVKVIILNPDFYDQHFRGFLNDILFVTDDPDMLKKELEDCSDSSQVTFTTEAEDVISMRMESSGFLTILYSIMAGSLILTFIGISGNQAFSFVTRKRETALLYSVALGRKKMKRLIFFESLFSILSSAAVATASAPIFYYTLSHLLSSITDDNVNILEVRYIDFDIIAIFIAVIVSVYLLTVLVPYRALRKMNIAQELKYE